MPEKLNRKKRITIYQLAFTALMAALVFVSTQFNIKIPLGMGVTSMISFGNIFCILSALPWLICWIQ